MNTNLQGDHLLTYRSTTNTSKMLLSIFSDLKVSYGNSHSIQHNHVKVKKPQDFTSLLKSGKMKINIRIINS